ncbi:MAG: Gfo/Idh/MocA family oxidoreductase [Candidatus Obscuribacterales bacterium]|nr:Gfo/Idh/MocA family oxidoreductase [Candidatus Obscuribacterales bacterium]
MQQVKLGIVGYGYWGPNLTRNFHSDERVEIKYICDRDPERLKQYRSQYQNVVFTTNYEDLLNDSSLQAIVIATPVETHFELAKQALSMGKHVLVEKPMCRSSKECTELIELARKKGLILMVDHTFLYHGPVRLMKQLLEKEELGDLLYFNSMRANLGLFQADVNVMWDLGAHDIAIMDYLLGRTPLSVHAIGASHTENAVEDIVYLTLSFADDLIAHVHVSWLSPVKIRQIFIGGSRRMIVFDDSSQSDKVRVYDKGIDTMKAPETDRERYRALIQYRHGEMRAPVYDLTEALRIETRHFIDCVLSGNKPISDGEAGRRVVQLLELADVSLKSGQSQKVVLMGVH